MQRIAILTLFFLAAGCAVVPDTPPPQAQFFERLLTLCGKSFEGRMASDDPADSDMAGERLVMHVRTCSDDEVRIPFHVGQDRSRTWVISRTRGGLRLKHVHRHADGSEDVLSRYGGDTLHRGGSRRQEFPADPFSRELFVAQGIPQSTTNVWAMEVYPGVLFAYELTRPDRHFRAEFDLSRPVAPPPAPWGGE